MLLTLQRDAIPPLAAAGVVAALDTVLALPAEAVAAGVAAVHEATVDPTAADVGDLPQIADVGDPATAAAHAQGGGAFGGKWAVGGRVRFLKNHLCHGPVCNWKISGEYLIINMQSMLRKHNETHVFAGSISQISLKPIA